jgi:predicted 2-oxoglutarate/Fe(II)-dependent dioxygenase YbiX/peroxiredoxin
MPFSLGWGEPAPWFRAQALDGNPHYAFDTVAGRHVLMLFLGNARHPLSVNALAVVQEHRQLFDDVSACFFGVTTDRQDATGRTIAQLIPGIRFFLDYDGAVSDLYGARSGAEYHPHWLLLDPALRVLGRFPVDRGKEAVATLRSEISKAAPEQEFAPVLIVPRVFEPDFCARLIEAYASDGGQDSGFMRDVGGKTVLVHDHAHKRRRDAEIADEQLRAEIAIRIRRRLNPAIQRALQFDPTRMERYIVACYSAGAGHFRPHRDNTTNGTAHRKFAVTLNLNAEGYDGGDLRFPEFGARTYRAPTGGAVVFSCSLLHEATPVTRGERYAFLPFLYDEPSAELRERNNLHLGEGVAEYRR